MGTYSDDRQSSLDLLLLEPARQCEDLKAVVAGPMYPPEIRWPSNVEHIEHLPPAAHRRFYNSQRFTLNLTRADMINAGYSPSVRLFEAAACGTPIISDCWPGIETFFDLHTEILVASSSRQVLAYINDMSEERRAATAHLARKRVLVGHTAEQRALELEQYFAEVVARPENCETSPQPAGAIA
jgi:spore maturation protein CgeB